MHLRLALASPVAPSGTRFSAAVAASVLVHVVVILGLGWKLPSLRSAAAPHNVLEVVLVNARSALAPDRPDVLAQANLDGGGNTDQDLRTSSPAPAVDARASAPATPPAAPVASAPAAAAKMLAVPDPNAPAAATDPRTPERQPPNELRARDLLDRSQEMVRLEAQIRRDYEANQKRRRTEFVGARASEYRFAAYVDNWRNKVERVGNLNYPAEARRQRLYGSLQLTVVLRVDGEVESVTLNRSSGHRVLDEAAMRIVKLAGPYDRFPEAIARDTDFISITRTWTFSREDAVSAR